MSSFQQYFQNRVEELLNASKSQTFFVFRGFGINQIAYLIEHPCSILSDTSMIEDETLNLEILDKNKKQLNRRMLLADGNIVGFYEELIAILSVVKDLSVSFDGKVVIVNNNLHHFTTF